MGALSTGISIPPSPIFAGASLFALAAGLRQGSPHVFDEKHHRLAVNGRGFETISCVEFHGFVIESMNNHHPPPSPLRRLFVEHRHELEIGSDLGRVGGLELVKGAVEEDPAAVD